MKNSSFYLLALTFSLLFIACKKNDSLKDVELNVHTQASFDTDSVKIYIDNQKQFDNVITTNPTLGYAGGFSTVITEGKHLLHVIINNKTHTEVFTLTKTLYIGIGYDKTTGKITTQVSTQKFAYD